MLSNLPLEDADEHDDDVVDVGLWFDEAVTTETDTIGLGDEVSIHLLAKSDGGLILTTLLTG